MKNYSIAKTIAKMEKDFFSEEGGIDLSEIYPDITEEEHTTILKDIGDVIDGLSEFEAGLSVLNGILTKKITPAEYLRRRSEVEEDDFGK